MVILLVHSHNKYRIFENFTTDEAIQNIASIYNSAKMIVNDFQSNTATIGTLTNTTLTSQNGTINNLTSQTGNVSTLKSDSGTIGTLTSTSGTINNINTNQINLGNSKLTPNEINVGNTKITSDGHIIWSWNSNSISNGIYGAPKRCLAVDANNKIIFSSVCDGTDPSTLFYNRNDQIVNVKTQMCMRPEKSMNAPNNGTVNLVVVPCNDNDGYQHWMGMGDQCIKNKASHMCISDPSDGSTAPNTWGCDINSTKMWFLIGDPTK